MWDYLKKIFLCGLWDEYDILEEEEETISIARSVDTDALVAVSLPRGVNTNGGTLRNSSHDLRGEIACPKFIVSPWLHSTIEPDINIKSWGYYAPSKPPVQNDFTDTNPVDDINKTINQDTNQNNKNKSTSLEKQCPIFMSNPMEPNAVESEDLFDINKYPPPKK